MTSALNDPETIFYYFAGANCGRGVQSAYYRENPGDPDVNRLAELLAMAGIDNLFPPRSSDYTYHWSVGRSPHAHQALVIFLDKFPTQRTGRCMTFTKHWVTDSGLMEKNGWKLAYAARILEALDKKPWEEQSVYAADALNAIQIDDL